MIRNINTYFHFSLFFVLKLPYATLNFRYFIKILPVAVRLKFSRVSLLIAMFAKKKKCFLILELIIKVIFLRIRSGIEQT